MNEQPSTTRNPDEHDFVAAYADLRRLAGYLIRESPVTGTPQATSLVNEAFLKYQGATLDGVQDRRHLINTVAMMMRQVLVDRIRRNQARKRGGDFNRNQTTLTGHDLPQPEFVPDEVIADLTRAIERLETHNDRWGEITRLRYLAGLTIEQTADVMGISPSLVKKDWSFARAWLVRAIHTEDDA